MKTAIMILSDPKSGADEALGRVFNALALAHECRSAGDAVEVVFKGAGTRWPAELARVGHPAHGLYQGLRESVAGASCACAEVFGARAEVEKAGVALLDDTPLPGTSGVAGIRRYYNEGWNVVTF